MENCGWRANKKIHSPKNSYSNNQTPQNPQQKKNWWFPERASSTLVLTLFARNISPKQSECETHKIRDTTPVSHVSLVTRDFLCRFKHILVTDQYRNSQKSRERTK